MGGRLGSSHPLKNRKHNRSCALDNSPLMHIPNEVFGKAGQRLYVGCGTFGCNSTPYNIILFHLKHPNLYLNTNS